MVVPFLGEITASFWGPKGYFSLEPHHYIMDTKVQVNMFYTNLEAINRERDKGQSLRSFHGMTLAYSRDIVVKG